MTKKLTPLIIGVLALVAVVFVAADAPAGFPVGETLWIALLAVLGLLVPWLLGLAKYSTWENRLLKTAFGYLISAVVAFGAAGIARIVSGSWPFEFNLTALLGTGVAWVQFCYTAFVKGWLEKKELTSK